jgi:hypothetical protein
MVHYGKADEVVGQRKMVLASAFEAHPERFVRGIPVPPPLPEAAWINKPKRESEQITLAEKISNSEVLMPGAAGDSRSNVKGDLSSQAVRLPGSYTKFKSEVSQNH